MSYPHFFLLLAIPSFTAFPFQQILLLYWRGHIMFLTAAFQPLIRLSSSLNAIFKHPVAGCFQSPSVPFTFPIFCRLHSFSCCILRNLQAVTDIPLFSVYCRYQHAPYLQGPPTLGCLCLSHSISFFNVISLFSYPSRAPYTDLYSNARLSRASFFSVNTSFFKNTPDYRP